MRSMQIKIFPAVIGNEEQKTVNARDLWKALGSKRQFGNWIDDRLSDFIEGQDFTVNKIVNGREANGRFASKEYIITLDVAKHLAMLERNEQGRKIRQYFIEIEKEYRRQVMHQIPDADHILSDFIRTYGAQWVLNQISLAEYLQNYAPKFDLMTYTKNGELRRQIRRGSNVTRNGRSPIALLKSAHPDLWGPLNPYYRVAVIAIAEGAR